MVIYGGLNPSTMVVGSTDSTTIKSPEITRNLDPVFTSSCRRMGLGGGAATCIEQLV